ncbi:MAG TPA: toll/interleukin-1 receptor domain-containing protein [Burkholderiaceae bacterium]|nr:toll/interleukin-1 receptor domain-containing protein [Burkholderiaceae bacterium]
MNDAAAAAPAAGSSVAAATVRDEIFISYAREDREVAQALAEAFTRRGWDAWWDREIEGGDDFRLVIEEKIRACRVALVLWSEYGKQSRFVRDEADRAAEAGKLLPLRIAPIEPPLGFGGIQTLDLIGWAGDESAPEFVEVAAAVGRRLRGSTAPERPPLTRTRAMLTDRRTLLIGGGALVAGGAGWWGFNLLSGGRTAEATRLTTLGLDELEAKAFGKARFLFNQALLADVRYAPAFFYRAQVLIQGGAPAEAMRDLQSALALRRGLDDGQLRDAERWLAGLNVPADEPAPLARATAAPTPPPEPVAPSAPEPLPGPIASAGDLSSAGTPPESLPSAPSSSEPSSSPPSSSAPPRSAAPADRQPGTEARTRGIGRAGDEQRAAATPPPAQRPPAPAVAARPTAPVVGARPPASVATAPEPAATTAPAGRLPSLPLTGPARDALDQRVQQLFAPAQDTRIAASTGLMLDAERLSDALPLALARANKIQRAATMTPAETAGVINTLVLAQAASPATLRLNEVEVQRLVAMAKEAGPQAAAQANATAGALTNAGTVPLAFVQIASEAQRPLANALLQRLRQANYQAPVSEVVGNRAPAQPEIRVHGRSDKSLARWMAKIVEEMLGAPVRILTLRNPKPEIDVFEIWFDRDVCIAPNRRQAGCRADRPSRGP